MSLATLLRHLRHRLPKPLLRALVPLWNLMVRLRVWRSRWAFARAGTTPEWLDRTMVDILRTQYAPPPVYGVDAESLARRGTERAAELLRVLPSHARPADTFLEIGCGDGMIGYYLRQQGKQVIGIDQQTALFDLRAVQAGVDLRQMDASALTLPDASVDVVYSYNTFEHLDDPIAVLEEAVRVLRPGGVLYLNFGPLYDAPMGLHAYYTLPIPYCQHLFSPEVLTEVCGTRPGVGLNRWTLAQYRTLWRRLDGRLSRARYVERLDVDGAELIARYPSCFRSKTSDVESLLVSAIEGAWVKHYPVA